MTGSKFVFTGDKEPNPKFPLWARLYWRALIWLFFRKHGRYYLRWLSRLRWRYELWSWNKHYRHLLGALNRGVDCEGWLRLDRLRIQMVKNELRKLEETPV